MKKASKSSPPIPSEFLQRMAVLLGDEYLDFLSSLQLPAQNGLRVNSLKISAKDFCACSPFHLSPVPWCSHGFIIDNSVDEYSPTRPGKHPYHAAGLYYLQEPSAMAAAVALTPLPGERVLDLAAAPGGKTTHLAAMMNNTGVLVANEIHPKRVLDLVENLERCGVTNSIVINESPQKLASHFGDYFDRVLLDAPCSGEGMFRKSELARQEWKPGLARSCAFRQLAILEQAARMVHPTGHLAYTTCTFSPDENETVVTNFLSHHPEFELEVIHPAAGYSPGRPDWIGLPSKDSICRTVRIWPHLANGEGHFISLFVKHDNSSLPQGHVKPERWGSSTKKTTSRVGNPEQRILEEFLRQNLDHSFDHSRLAMVGSHIYHQPQSAPDLTGLNVVHPGWWLGSVSNQRFTPSHSLAMGLKHDQAADQLKLHPGDSRLMAYITGESFPDPGADAWVLITVDGYPLGWGKRVQNVLKNYYPHNLRRTL